VAGQATNTVTAHYNVTCCSKPSSESSVI